MNYIKFIAYFILGLSVSGLLGYSIFILADSAEFIGWAIGFLLVSSVIAVFCGSLYSHILKAEPEHYLGFIITLIFIIIAGSILQWR